MVVADETGGFKRMLPIGDYSTIDATPESVKVDENGDGGRSQIIQLKGQVGTDVPILSTLPVVRQAPPWREDGEWLAVNLRELFPGVLVTAMAVDGENQLWIGSTLGLIKYDGFEYVLYSLLEQDGLSIDQMGFDPAGGLWIVDVRRGVYRFEEGQLSAFDFMDPALLRLDELMVGEDGAVWFGGMLGIVCYQGGRFRLVEAIQNYRIAAAKSIAVSSQGSLWIAGPSNRLHRYFNGRLEEVPGWQQDRAIQRASYGSLGTDSANHIYLNGAEGQLLRFDDGVKVSEIQRSELARLDESIVELVVHGPDRVWTAGGDVHRITSDGMSHSGKQLGLEFSEIEQIAIETVSHCLASLCLQYQTAKLYISRHSLYYTFNVCLLVRRRKMFECELKMRENKMIISK